MKRFTLAAGLMASVVLPSAALAVELEVTHWWTSGGEAAAVKVMADAVTAAGITWVDGAIAGGDNARPIIISRIAGGDRSTVESWRGHASSRRTARSGEASRFMSFSGRAISS